MPPPAALACGRSLYSRAASAVLRLGNRAFAAHARWLTLGLAAVFVVGAVSRHILAQAGSGESYSYSYLPYLPYIGQRLGEEGRGALQFRSFPTEPSELKEMMETLNHVCRETDEAEQPFVQVRPQLYQCALPASYAYTLESADAHRPGAWWSDSQGICSQCGKR